MPNDKDAKTEVVKLKEPVLTSDTEKTMTVLMQKVMGEGSFVPTEKQADEILTQRSKIIDYVHNDKIRDSKDKRFYFGCFLAGSLIVVLCVLFFAKEYLTQVISLIVGALGGYGFGKSQQDI